MTVLRSAVFNLYFFALTLLLGLFCGIPLRLLAPGRVIGLARFWGRLVLAGLRAICGIRFAVSGRENLPASGPALIASQHQSAFDTLVWLLLVPWPAYVVKQELARVPVFGPLLRPGGQILVDRSAGAAALRSMVAEARARLRGGAAGGDLSGGDTHGAGRGRVPAARHRRARGRDGHASDSRGHRFGAALGAAGLPQACGHDPCRDRDADRPRPAAARAA